ncbi:Uncharacterized protein involved in outer membrane biogenesis [Modicisalibacter ilicicola DSM 19980]|uniref:Uncharacterized protein involved in outer membrane biogenesis n=1 Tax=Modicisalibacter ilicicola DSM 19980 TaxID=1121942 RepID=A0A1M4V071_9GAMM|nr:AsmA family protein [Halomonas ilicicola]SHE62345.1 Uncharacterized protein involved in outer membrane biogenesis [Halomonas ilicicola DSM 19980]
MRKVARWGLWVALGLGAVLAGALLLVESPWVREWLEGQAAKRLNGRDVEIGALEIVWGWPLTVRLEELTIANPDWVAHSRMLDLDALTITLDLSALVQGSVPLERLHLQRPELHLARRRDGATSWTGLFEDEKEGAGGGAPIDPEMISIDRGRLTYRDAALGLDLAADFRTRKPDQGPPRLLLDGQGAYQDGSAVSGSVSVTLEKRPRLHVQLAADRLELEPWGVGEPGSARGQRAAEQAVEQKVEKLAWERRWAERLAPLAKIDARIEMTVDRLSYADTRFSDVSLRGDLERGRLTLERLHTALGAGEMTARGWLEVGSDTLDGAIDARMGQLDLGQALAPLGFSELGTLDGQLHARLEQGALALDDTSLAYRAPESDLLLRVNAESTAVGETSEAGVRLRGSGSRRGEPFEYDLKVGPLLTLNDPDKAYPVQGWATSRQSRLEVEGSLEQPLKIARVQGKFRLSGPNPARLNRLTGLNLPALPPYDVQGELRVKDELVRLLDLGGRFGNSDVGGDVRLRLGERNKLWATLNSRRLDLDDLAPLLGVAPDTESGETASARQQRRAVEQARRPGIFPDAQWNLDGLRRMDAEVHYRAANVSAKDIPMSEFELDLSLEAGVLTLEPLQAGIGGGRLRAQVRMDARDEPLDGRLELSLRRINLKPVLRKVELSDIARDTAGTVGGRGRVRFRGNSLDEAMAGLDGTLALAMSGGRLDMLVVEALGLDLAEALTAALVDSDEVVMRCAFTRLDATNGMARVEQFFIDTADTNLTGGGSIDLGDERLDLVFEAHPKDPSLLASDSPVTLQGRLDAPRVEVVSRELVARGVLSVLGAVLAPPLAILPWIEPGTGENVGPGCRQVLREFREGKGRE